jgi:hypothetical protein
MEHSRNLIKMCMQRVWFVWACIQKFRDWVDNKIYAYLWYYSLKSNTKGYGGKTQTDSQNSDTSAPSGR